MLLPFLAAALAAPNGLVATQGLLTDSTGAAISGTRTVTFRLYSDAALTQERWEGEQVVAVDRGAFSTLLGQGTALDLALFATWPDLWLTAELDGEAETAGVLLATAPKAAFAHRADTLDGLDSAAFYQKAEAIPWSALSDVPTALADGDQDTTYTAGAGLTLSGTQFAATPYTAGAGLTLSGTQFAVNQGALQPTWGNIQGVPTDLANGDQDTTYTAGTGLTLSGTQFAVNQATVEGWATASAGGVGSVVQIVYADTTARTSISGSFPFDDTIPQQSEGGEFLTATITPRYANSDLLVDLSAYVSESSNHSDPMVMALFRDGTANAITAGWVDLVFAHNLSNVSSGGTNNFVDQAATLRVMVPASSTTATTFKARCGGNGGGCTINGLGSLRYLGGSIRSTLTVTEIKR